MVDVDVFVDVVVVVIVVVVVVIDIVVIVDIVVVVVIVNRCDKLTSCGCETGPKMRWTSTPARIRCCARCSRTRSRFRRNARADGS